MYKKDLQESFNDKDLYMHDKRKKEIIKTLKCENVYIIKRIINDFNEFTLLLTMQRNILSLFLTMHSLINLNNLTNLNYFTSYINVIYYENEIKVNYN